MESGFKLVLQLRIILFIWVIIGRNVVQIERDNQLVTKLNQFDEICRKFIVLVTEIEFGFWGSFLFLIKKSTSPIGKPSMAIFLKYSLEYPVGLDSLF